MGVDLVDLMEVDLVLTSWEVDLVDLMEVDLVLTSWEVDLVLTSWEVDLVLTSWGLISLEGAFFSLILRLHQVKIQISIQRSMK